MSDQIEAGRRVSHIHVVTLDDGQWERVAFRDHLRAHPATAAEYAALKRELAARFAGDREVHTYAKTALIVRVTALATGQSPDGVRPAG